MKEGFSQAAYDNYISDNITATLKSQGGNYGGGSETLIIDYQKKIGSLCARDYKGVGSQYVNEGKLVVEGMDGYNATLTGDKSATLGVNCGMSTGRNGVCAFHGQASCTAGVSASEKVSPTLMNAKQVDILTDALVRRLTPLECERLQGFFDFWTVLDPISDMSEAEYDFWRFLLLDRAVREGKARQNSDGVFEVWRAVEIENEEGEIERVWENTHKPYKHKTKPQMVKWYNKSFTEDADSQRYKALGNSIAVPSWFYVLQKLTLCCGADCTMASLFDGIGGFPLIWEMLNGRGSCLWASEIEEFPIAVTKVRFPEEVQT